MPALNHTKGNVSLYQFRFQAKGHQMWFRAYPYQVQGLYRYDDER
jgi:hypothetical protein